MKKLLVVEDDEGLAASLTGALEETYDVSTAADGLEALERVRAEHFDVLLVDVNLPRMDGLQLIRAMKDEHIAVPVLMTTGWVNRSSATCLAKPYKLADLERRLADVVAASEPHVVAAAEDPAIEDKVVIETNENSG